jgi:hypothetical protein
MDIDEDSQDFEHGEDDGEGDMSMDDTGVISDVIMTRRRSSVAPGRASMAHRRSSIATAPEYSIPLGMPLSAPKGPSALMLALENATHGGSVIVEQDEDGDPVQESQADERSMLGGLHANQSQEMSFSDGSDDGEEGDMGDRTLNFTKELSR